MKLSSILDFIWRFGRVDPNQRSSLRDQNSRTQWWAGSIGAKGPEALNFDVRRLGTPLPHAAGIFLLCAKQEGGGWMPLLAGETQDLATRVRSHELMPEALLLGATHVHFVRSSNSRAERIVLAGQIVHAYDPILNQPGAKGFMQSIEDPGPRTKTIEPPIAASAVQRA